MPRLEVAVIIRIELPPGLRRLIGILFTQRAMNSPTPPQVFTDFWTQAYAALL